MGFRRALRTAPVLLASVTLACGGASSPAATPSEDPAEQSAESRSGASTDPAAPSADTTPEASLAEPEEIILGKAHFVLGAYPPWSPLDEVRPGRQPGDPPAAPEEAPAPPAKLGTSWRLLRTITVGIGYLSQAELSRDGSEAFVLSDDDGVLRRYEAATGKLIDNYPYPQFKRFDSVGFTLLPHEKTPSEVLLSGPVGVGVLDLTRREFASTWHGATEVRGAGRPGLLGLTLIQTETQRGYLQLSWYPGRGDGGEISAFAFEERPDNWALSSDGSKLVVLYYPSNELEVLDLRERRVLPRIPAPKYAHGLALSPDDRFFAVGGEELWIYDATTGLRVATETRFDNNIHAARFTPDGKLLLVSAYDGKARSYAFREDGKLGARQLLAHRGTANVYALGLNEAGDRLVTSSGDQTIKIWQR